MNLCNIHINFFCIWMILYQGQRYSTQLTHTPRSKILNEQWKYLFCITKKKKTKILNNSRKQSVVMSFSLAKFKQKEHYISQVNRTPQLNKKSAQCLMNLLWRNARSNENRSKSPAPPDVGLFECVCVCKEMWVISCHNSSWKGNAKHNHQQQTNDEKRNINII